MALLGPPAVAVHNDGDVRRQAGPVNFLQQLVGDGVRHGEKYAG
jgi:hypothetical protein